MATKTKGQVEHHHAPNREWRANAREALARFLRWWPAIALGLMVAVAAFPGGFSPHDPLSSDLSQRLSGPLDAGVLGMDSQGRDVLSRLVWGLRPALVVALTPTLLAGVVGVALGATAAYLQGWRESVLMRALDVALALPPVMLAILVAASLGAGLRNMVAALTLVLVPAFARVAYKETAVIARAPFITASRICGLPTWRILTVHLVPNIYRSSLAYAASVAGLMVVVGAGLSFLGVGVQPPTPDWGRMINEGQNVLLIAPHVSTLPGIAILSISIVFNSLADRIGPDHDVAAA